MKIDFEREYLIDDALAQEHIYSEYLKLCNEGPDILNSKIEVNHGETTRIEVGEEKLFDYQPIEGVKS